MPIGRLADRIRLARRNAKLSQTALAQRVGVTPSAVAQWEHPDGTKPGVDRLQAIATATGAAFEWLATGGGDQRRRRGGGDATPAVVVESFAQDLAEELLLDRFRALPKRARDLLSSLLVELTSARR
ncbi:helix-turn-helix domain-containing protein [Pseudolysobacter antarcticus]|uniref:helix-turn-helix domain-containing protein n=1 Tax=Pseudolysobacter antarcticus TaxID=2511995 RepID=UPI0013EC2574|nr:helix-turn-helix transcriptional regulator [Pseudolysobacter antarcticus]